VRARVLCHWLFSDYSPLCCSFEKSFGFNKFLRTVKMPVPFHKPSQLSTVKLNNNCVVADILRCVTDAFTVPRVQRINNGDSSKVLTSLVESSIDTAGRLEIHCRSGLILALRGCLLLHGIRTSGSCTASQLHAVSAGFGAWNPQVVDFVTRVDWGQVLVNRRECNFATVVAEIINGLPTSKIVVIVDDNAQQFRGLLLPLTFRRVDLACAQNFVSDGSNVVVSTWRSLGRTGLQRADVVVVVDPLITDKLDPMFAVYAEPEDVARYCPKLDKSGDVTGKLIAVLDAENKYSPFEAARLSQVFGCQSVRVLSDNTDPTTRVYPRVASILWARVSCPAGVGNIGDHLDVKRAAVWANPILNRVVAKLAKALAAGNITSVKGLFKIIPEGWSEGKPLRVVVYVESLDHAETLSQKLPGCPIVTAHSEPPFNASVMIATEMGACRLDGNAIDVVIRADLGFGVPNHIATEWMSSPIPFGSPLYIVDFVARDGALLRQSLTSRRDGYLDAHCPEYGIHPDIHAYRMFRRAVTRRDYR